MKHTKTLSAVALVAALGLSLTACGGGAPAASATSPNVEPIAASPSATPSEPAAGKKSPRGNLIKKVGEPAGMYNPENNKPTVNFTVDSIKVGAPCTGAYPQPADNGHLVTVTVTAETTEELGLVEFSSKTFDVSPSGFKFIGANGTTFNGNLGSAASFSCLDDSETFPQAGMGPAEKVTGKVVLDVPAKTGTLVFKDLFGSAAWEYKF